MDQTLRWLKEFGERCEALPDNMRAFLEPTDLGLRVWLEVTARGQRGLHAQRLTSWAALEACRVNPLVGALDDMLRQVNSELERAE